MFFLITSNIVGGSNFFCQFEYQNINKINIKPCFSDITILSFPDIGSQFIYRQIEKNLKKKNIFERNKAPSGKRL